MTITHQTPLTALDLGKISAALASIPTAAYSAPHDYPHAAPLFRPAPLLARERVHCDAMRLYVHIPFCNYACSFCCYAKKVGVDEVQMRRYVRALKKELEWIEPGTPVSQFFIGGGTPTALPAELLDEVLEAISSRMPYVEDTVHTVEASPESVTNEHLRVMAARGVGRISMGIQSMQDGVLESVRRDHGKEAALEACHRIVEAGFILNVDLMYGLPGQSEAGFREDFKIAMESGVHSVTAYNLRLNERTAIARSLAPSERFDLAGLLRWRAFVQDTAAEFGFSQTRWHTFKRLDSIASRHAKLPTFDADFNGLQFGIGMSARSSLNHSMYRNHSNMVTYLSRVESGQSPVEEVIYLSGDDLRTQYIAGTLGDGNSMLLSDYEQTFGNPLQQDHGEAMQRLLRGGLLETDGNRLTMTKSGRLLYDLVTLAFYPIQARTWLLDKLQSYQLGDATSKPVILATTN